MKTCILCPTELSEFRNVNSKYCPSCQITVRKQVQINNRLKRKAKMQTDDITYICTQIYNKYKQGALRRNLTFELSIKDFMRQFRVNCHYCNTPISNVGFDRVDNTKGYTLSNVVPCCTICNMMKHNLTQQDFIKQALLITQQYSQHSAMD